MASIERIRGPKQEVNSAQAVTPEPMGVKGRITFYDGQGRVANVATDTFRDINPTRLFFHGVDVLPPDTHTLTQPNALREVNAGIIDQAAERVRNELKKLKT